MTTEDAMTTLTKDRIAELRKLAEAATQEPWQLGTAGRCNVDVAFGGDDVVGVALVPSPRNQAYIAALSPEVVTALLDHAECLRELVELKAQRDRLDSPTFGAEHPEWRAVHDEYYRRKSLAWAKAAQIVRTP